jgi:uncharacterized protein with HEPN domain
MRCLSREWQMFWQDMHQAANKVLSYTYGFDAAAFSQNELVQDAVLRNLEVIGEAAKQIPPDIRAKVIGVDWRRVIGFRDIVAHAYFGIDQAILWNIVSEKVPELIAAMDACEIEK